MPNLSPFLLLPACTPARPLAPPRLIVVIAGEAAAMPACLLGLLRQRGLGGLRLDATELGVVLAPAAPPADPAAFLAGLAARLPFPLRLAPLARPGANAGGWAWRGALEAALDWCGPRGIILTLDAATVPEPGWAAALVQAIAEGAAAATAGIRPQPGPASDYAALLDAIAARLDPGSAPEPDGAASLAVTAASLAGGIPAGGPGALLAVLGRRHAEIRGLPAALAGTQPAAVPERLGAACRRFRARAALRRLWQDGVGSVVPETPALWALARRCRLPAGELARLLGARSFGAAWAGLEAACPSLRPQPLAPGALRVETLRARLLLGWLRLGPQRAGRPAAPGGLAAGGWPGICID